LDPNQRNQFTLCESNSNKVKLPKVGSNVIVPVFVNHTLDPSRLPRFLQKHTDLANTESYLFFSFYNESNRINILCTSCGYYVQPCSPDDGDPVKQVPATVGFRGLEFINNDRMLWQEWKDKFIALKSIVGILLPPFILFPLVHKVFCLFYPPSPYSLVLLICPQAVFCL
jgi:hypothetical protein